MELIYGPVQSLRFGSTLGINLLGGSKVCSYNCGYCHLGPTVLTMNKVRKDYDFPTLAQIQDAFREYIKKSVTSDAIVISGNGEPTLYPQFDDAVQVLKELRDQHLPGVPLLALSNGAHLDNKRVVAGLNQLDDRVIKVDAGSDAFLQTINVPLVRINMAKFLSSVDKLKDCIVQSLFVGGPNSNAGPESVDEWIEVVGMIKPKSVQICTVTRAAFQPTIHKVEDDVLDGIAFKLKKRTGLESQVFVTQKS